MGHCFDEQHALRPSGPVDNYSDPVRKVAELISQFIVTRDVDFQISRPCPRSTHSWPCPACFSQSRRTNCSLYYLHGQKNSGINIRTTILIYLDVQCQKQVQVYRETWIITTLAVAIQIIKDILTVTGRISKVFIVGCSQSKSLFKLLQTKF